MVRLIFKKKYECSVEWVQTYRMAHAAAIRAYSKEEAKELFKNTMRAMLHV